MEDSRKEKMRDLDVLATDFLTVGIGSKVVFGITYLFVLNSEKETMEKYDEMVDLANEMGIKSEAFVLREKVSNGVIYDMNMQAARNLTIKVMKQVNKMTNGKSPVADVIQDKPENRRNKEISDMAKHIIKERKEGKSVIQLAIYSRNREDRIKFTAKNSKGVETAVEFKAFNIRKSDIQNVCNLCRHQGVIVTGVELNEILPTKTGVRCIVRVSGGGRK